MSKKHTNEGSIDTGSNGHNKGLVNAREKDNLPAFLSESELASWLNIATGTLRNWRVSGNGPSYCKISRSVVRYPMKSVLEWLENSLVNSTSEVC